MALTDYVLSDQNGSVFRSELNAIISILVANNSHATTPTTTFAYMFWADTTSGYIKQRNAANSAWITLWRLSDGMPSLPRGFINGLELTNAADADHDITVGTGVARDSANAENLEITSNFTKQIDASWAVGNNAGGLFSGTVANATWYHVFLIRKDSDGTIDSGFDTSLTAANKPAGYTAYRYLGSVLTDGTANILGFTQHGNMFLWDDPPLDVDVTNLGTTAVLYTLSVPPGIKSLVEYNMSILHAALFPSVYISSVDANDEAPSLGGTAPGGTNRIQSVAGNFPTGGFTQVLTNTSSQIRARSTEASTEFEITTLRWEIQREEL